MPAKAKPKSKKGGKAKSRGCTLGWTIRQAAKAVKKRRDDEDVVSPAPADAEEEEPVRKPVEEEEEEEPVDNLARVTVPAPPKGLVMIGIALAEEEEPVDTLAKFTVTPPPGGYAAAAAAGADPKQPIRKKRRKDFSDFSRSFKTIPEIMDHQDELAKWVQENELLYNPAHRSHRDRTKKEALYTDKADEIRAETPELCGKLSLFYYQVQNNFVN